MNLIRCAHSASFLHPLPVLTPPALFPGPWTCYFNYQWSVFLCPTDFFLKYNWCFQSVLRDHSEASSKHLDVRWWGKTSHFLSGCLQQLSLRSSSNELARQREPEVVLVGTNSDTQTSQKMGIEKRMFFHTGKVVPRFQSNRVRWSLSPPSYKYVRWRVPEDLSPGAQFKLSPAMPT